AVVDVERLGDLPELLLRQRERVLAGVRGTGVRRHRCVTLLDPEVDLRAARWRRARNRRPGDEAQLVAARRQAPRRRVAAGDAEAVAPREQVALAVEDATEAAVRVVEEDVEARDRFDLDPV